MLTYLYLSLLIHCVVANESALSWKSFMMDLQFREFVTLWEQDCLTLLITWLIFVDAFTKQLWKATASTCLVRFSSVCLEQMDFC